MNEFKTYHPITTLLYFLFVIGFAMFFMHPVCLGISLFSALLCSAVQSKGGIKKDLVYMIPMVVLMGLMNPLFSHEGVTILTYLPDGNPLTLESVIYGFCAAVMIVSVICRFSSFNKIMTSDRIVYLFGRTAPALSLVFSMTLRFVPRFVSHMKDVANARKCIGKDVSSGSMVKRAKNGIAILSATVTWALENAVETADSMKGRGYGSRDRTSFSLFRFEKRDAVLLSAILCLGGYTIAGCVAGQMDFVYFPMIKATEMSPFAASVFVCYFILSILPVIIELWEVRRWRSLRSRV